MFYSNKCFRSDKTNSSPRQITGPAREAEMDVSFTRRSSPVRSSWSTPAPPAWTTGWSLYWRCPRSRCRGWCSCKHTITRLSSSQTLKIDLLPDPLRRTCPLRCRSRPWWFRVWSRRDWSLRASPVRSSPHSDPPIPETTTTSLRFNISPHQCSESADGSELTMARTGPELMYLTSPG